MVSKEKRKIHYSWEWVNNSLDTIGEKLEFRYNLKYITGIPRGGLIPAVLGSHKFNLQFIPILEAKTLSLENRKKVLVIDDISDTGETFKKVEDLSFITAALAIRHSTSFLPHLFAQEIEDDHWLVFPWEAENSKTVQDYLV